MNTLKIVTASLGVIASTALLWHTKAQAEAVDQFEPLFFQQTEKVLTQQPPEEALAMAASVPRCRAHCR